MVRQAHHHPEPGRRANTNDQISKYIFAIDIQQVIVMFWLLEFGILILFVI